MFRKIILSVLSCVASATVAQAGHLELVAELSDEQRTAVQQKFADPYISASKENAGLTWVESVRVAYPHLRPLKTIKYTTMLAQRITEGQAQLIAQSYINSAKTLAVNEIQTTPFMNWQESPTRIIERRSSVDYPDEIISTHGEAVYCTLETSLTSNPNTLCVLQQHVIKELRPEIENLAYNSNSFGSIAFGRTGFFEEKGLENNRNWLAIGEMEKEIGRLSSQSGHLILTFTSFKLNYIEDNGEIKFSIPFNLTDQQVSQ